MSNTKEKIVELGRDFIQHVGYHSFNYKQIATQLDIKNAAIHHYYPAKEDLGVAVIEKDRADFEQMVKVLENATPTEKTEAILHAYNQYFKEGKRLCILSTCGSAYQDIPEKMQQVSKNYLDELIAWLTETFKKGLQTGEFKFSGSADDMTSRWVATLPGILIAGRMQGEAYFDNAITLLRKSLKSI
jgi:TetR/AcrR family transcriptional repressor of nem operon